MSGRRSVILAALIFGVLSLTGCSVDDVSAAGWIQLPDGGRVLCATTSYGIDCDWQHAEHEAGAK